MTNQSKFTLAIGVMTIALAIAGCSHQSTQITTLSEVKYAPVDPQSVEVFDVGTNPPFAYDVLGRVYTRKKGSPLNQGSPDGIRKDLQSEAAKIGADAILGFYASKLDDHGEMPNGCWGSAIAVKKLGNSASNVSRPPDCSVLMISAQGSSLLPYCQVQLEKRGYYAVSIEQKLKEANFLALDSLAIDSLLNNLIATEFAFVLVFDVVSGNVGVEPDALVSNDHSRTRLENTLQTISNRIGAQSAGELGSATVTAKLFSVSSGRPIWNATASGTESIFLSMQGQVKGGAENAVRNLFKSLPKYAKSTAPVSKAN